MSGFNSKRNMARDKLLEHSWRDRVVTWFGNHRKVLWNTIGWINVVGGINSLLQGRYSEGIVWLLLGSMILFDNKEFK